jgi:membrane protein YqaA with SNARE-associated domain
VAESAPPAAAPVSRNPFRRLYAWILSWAHHRAGTAVLGVLAFLDSSVFPIPPLFLQVALSLERPKRAWWYATVNLAASVAGAVVGYLIGKFLFSTVGKWIIETFSYQDHFDKFGEAIRGNIFGFTLFYSFFPFPYKVLTIASGFFEASLPLLLIASVIGRGARFYLLAAVCFWRGADAKEFIDKRFNWVLAGIGVLVLVVLVVMKVGFTR